MLDGNKLFDALIENTELHDIPITYIVTVTKCVLEAINSGDCFIKENDYV